MKNGGLQATLGSTFGWDPIVQVIFGRYFLWIPHLYRISMIHAASAIKSR